MLDVPVSTPPLPAIIFALVPSNDKLSFTNDPVPISQPAINPEFAFMLPSKNAEPDAYNPNSDNVPNFGDVIPARLPILTTAEPLDLLTSINGLLSDDASIATVPPLILAAVPPTFRLLKLPLTLSTLYVVCPLAEVPLPFI